MQYFKTISELISSYKTLLYPGRIFYEYSQKDDYTKSQFWVLSSKELKNEEMIESKGGLIPESLAPYNITSFIDVGTFQDIIEIKLENYSNLSVTVDTKVFVDAINHYLKTDDFMDKISSR